MTPDFKARLAACLSRQAVVELTSGALTTLFSGSRSKLFMLEELLGETGRPEGWRSNPVLELFLDQESALHEAQIVDNATWRKLCPRADHGHVLVGPIISSGKLAGAIAVTRDQGIEPFGSTELRQMNRLSLYVSTRLAELEAAQSSLGWEDLTPREGEVAGCVQQGLRNAEIAARLSLSEHTVKQNLKSVFRKLGLRSRTELAVHGSRN